MKNKPKLHTFCRVVVIATILLAGCAGSSPSVNFYTLNALSDNKTDIPEDDVSQNLAIGVGPVTFPGYLDRPQIVTRKGQNQLDISEFHRWGDSLLKDFSRIMAKNVSILLSTNRVTVYPWPNDFFPDYQVGLDVEQFVGQVGQSVSLDVRWSVMGRDGKDLVIQTSAIEEPVTTADYEGLVAAMSRAIDTLSRKITKEIHRLERTASAQESEDEKTR
jgi:uncharacterized lipoprotein YmbA